jgi:scyllo-inositol 2-dehydrogenase (NADP+)
MAGTRIRTAILGYGRSGSTLHADPLERLSADFDLAAVCDIEAAARAKAGRRFGCALHEDYRAMLAAGGLDLVVIVTRSDQHCAMTCDCLEAGVDVLVTKPWAVDEAEARRMIDAARSSGRRLLPWLPARWGCDLVRLRQIVASGAIGKVHLVRRAEMTLGTRSDWQTLRRNGGGYLLNWGPHLVDQPVQLHGGRVRSVWGDMKRLINPGDAEDQFTAVLTMDDGALVIAEFGVGAAVLPTWVVQGTRGTIVVRDMALEVHRAAAGDGAAGAGAAGAYRGEPGIVVDREDLGGGTCITMANRYGDAMAIYPHIARALRGEEPYAVSLDSALGLTRVLDAVRRSAATGAVVRMEEA